MAAARRLPQPAQAPRPRRDHRTAGTGHELNQPRAPTSASQRASPARTPHSPQGDPPTATLHARSTHQPRAAADPPIRTHAPSRAGPGPIANARTLSTTYARLRRQGFEDPAAT